MPRADHHTAMHADNRLKLGRVVKQTPTD